MEIRERKARIKRLLTWKRLIEEELAMHAVDSYRELDRIEMEIAGEQEQPQDSQPD
jgi:hypothetical protein